jgi:hypothetical protein
MGNSPRTGSIHILDDDSLLHVFYLYRPFLSGEDQDDYIRLRGGDEIETRGRWWYKPAHVCQRWRNIILGSASYLGLFLVCTYGTPVADMLAHSPPLPLIVHYVTKGRDVTRLTTDEEQGIIFALKQRERVLRVRLSELDTGLLEKFIAVMDEEFPILEYLIISTPTEVNCDNSTILIFPENLQAPRLRLLWLRGFQVAIPMGYQLLTTAVSPVTLYLVMVHPSTYFHPNALLQWISLMAQLEALTIYFKVSTPNRDVERQLAHTPTIAHVTLPNLRDFAFHGVSTYLEALVRRITAPRLKKLRIEFFSQLTFFVPRLLQLINTAEDLRFHRASLFFIDRRVEVAVYPHGDFGSIETYAFAIEVLCWHLDWQVSSMVQISNLLNQVFSAVERLDLVHKVHDRSSEEHNEVDRAEWRRLLMPFSNVKTLRIAEGLVEDLSRCLLLEDGELPLEVLPELQELTYYGSGDTGDVFTPFIDARRNAGRPVKLDRQ